MCGLVFFSSFLFVIHFAHVHCAVDVALTYVVKAGERVCFYEELKNTSLEVDLEYEVVLGGSHDINFQVLTPSNHFLVNDIRQSQGSHTLKARENDYGDYQICLDNSFSRVSGKTVYFEYYIASYTDEEELDRFGGLDDPEDISSYEITLDYIFSAMANIRDHVMKCRHMQAVFRNMEHRDRYLAESNLSLVGRFSFFNIVVMIGTSLTQRGVIVLFKHEHPTWGLGKCTEILSIFFGNISQRQYENVGARFKDEPKSAKKHKQLHHGSDGYTIVLTHMDFRMFRHRRRRRGDIGLMLLLMQVLQMGWENIPPVTLFTVVANVCIYLGFPEELNFSIDYVCNSFIRIWYLEEYRRILLAAWYHLDDMHLYYNMSSLLWKGRKLELRLGSPTFCCIIASFSVICNVVTVGLSYLLSEIMTDSSYLRECAAGFSGVLFGLKVLLSNYEPNRNVHVLFFTVPSRLACWVELLLIQVLVPNVSFTGHLAGILVGLAFVAISKSFRQWKYLFDMFFSFFGVSPFQRRYTYRHGTTSSPSHSNYGRYANQMSEQEQLNEALRRSREEHNVRQPYYDNSSTPSAPPYENIYPDIDELRQRRAAYYH